MEEHGILTSVQETMATSGGSCSHRPKTSRSIAWMERPSLMWLQRGQNTSTRATSQRSKCVCVLIVNIKSERSGTETVPICGVTGFKSQITTRLEGDQKVYCPFDYLFSRGSKHVWLKNTHTQKKKNSFHKVLVMSLQRWVS